MKDIRVIKLNIGAPNSIQTQLRIESARLWNCLVKIHKYCRRRHWQWPSQGSLEKHFKGRFELHSQTIQALIGKFIANIQTTQTNRKNGDTKARYPWRDRKKYQIVMWPLPSIATATDSTSLMAQDARNFPSNSQPICLAAKSWVQS